MFVSYRERLAKIIVLNSARIRVKLIDFHTNICYTMVSTFKEDGLCIERLWASWKRGKIAFTASPLILQGARQVGKTYSILEFGRTHYENVAYFNFETNPKLNETFEENISPDYLIPILSHIAGQTIVTEKKR